MAVGVVDRLEVVDIAEGQAQGLARGLGLGIIALQFRLERAAVGQAGQEVDFRIAPRPIERMAQVGGFFLALSQLCFRTARALEHGTGIFGQLGNHVACIGLAFQLAHVLFQRIAVFARGGVRGVSAVLELGDGIFQLADQLFDCLVLFLGLAGGHPVQPVLGDRHTGFALAGNLAHQPGIEAGDGAVGNCQVVRGDLQVMIHQEFADRLNQSQAQVAAAFLRAHRRPIDGGIGDIERVAVAPDSQPAQNGVTHRLFPAVVREYPFRIGRDGRRLRRTVLRTFA